MLLGMPIILRNLTFGTLLWISALLPSQANESSLSHLPAVLQKHIESNEVAGAVTLVAKNGQIVAHHAVGHADLTRKKIMTVENMFWIASMTKPITAVAVMMLVEEGHLSIDDPVQQYLPEFKDPWLVESKTKASMQLIRPHRKITIRDLLTHTSGLDSVPTPRYDTTLGELAAAYGQKPLKFQPGSKWSYSNSGINTLGRIIEVVSGKDYGHFLQERIFTPLQMIHTTFWPTDYQVARIAKSYRQKEKEAELSETSIYRIPEGLTDRHRVPWPAGGLFSTAEDMHRFYQMMLNGGEWNGHRLIAESTVQAMTQTQTGNIKTGFTPGMSWGLGFQVVKTPQGVTEMLSKGTFGHGGAYGTQSWADPATQTVYILMIQRSGLANGDASAIRTTFQSFAATALSQ